MATKRSESGKRHHDVPPWEWVIAGLGAALLVAVIAFSIYRIATEGNEPPAFAIEVESVTRSGESYLANLKINNSGDQTAAGLMIEGKLMDGDEEIETSSVTLTYAPANSTRNAAMIFTKDPRSHRLLVRAVGFERP